MRGGLEKICKILIRQGEYPPFLWWVCDDLQAVLNLSGVLCDYVDGAMMNRLILVF